MTNLTAGIEDLRRRLGSLETERMEGDNLAVTLCSHFDNPDQDSEDDHGWTPDAIAGCDEVLDAIHAHYVDQITTLQKERDEALSLWPAWAKQIYDQLVEYGFDNGDGEEINLPQVMADWFSDFDPADHKRAIAAEARCAVLEGALAKIADARTAMDGGSIAECRRIATKALSTQSNGSKAHG